MSGICFDQLPSELALAGDAGDRSKSFVMVEAARSEYAEGMFGEIDVEGKTHVHGIYP